MKLARINTLLLIAIILVNGYIIALPFIPGIIFWAQTQDGQRQQQLEARIHTKPGSASDSPSPQGQQLTIPRMNLDEAVHQGPTAKTLRHGLWHRPHTSTPDRGGNTVIVGHRLTYTDPKGTLYHLDKVKVGDSIGLTWRGKQYVYKVTTTKVVAATEVSIEAPTDKPRLTVYTCTPLWLPKDRLVVVADLQEIL
jgi:LPXTG-site transpeptidase (sortase) family protein